MLVRRGIALLSLIAVAGCSGGRHPQAAPLRSLVLTTPPPLSPTATPRPARPGSACGQVTTLTGAHAAVAVVRGRTTCAEATRVFERYFDPSTPAEGLSGLVVIGHWTCQTRQAGTTCVSRTATIRARP